MQETSRISSNNRTSTCTQNENLNLLLLCLTSSNTSDETPATTASQRKIKAVVSAHFKNEVANNLHSDTNEHQDQSRYVVIMNN